MKKLTRMKLINWHRFENCTIDFGSATLLSGENGAGKTTLLDAIQFVVLCSAGSFNKAAHENGKRKLTGYIRCKTGKESRPYERTGEVSAHVALEFYEESRQKYFILGAVVDSASEGQETTGRYLIDGSMLSEDMFFKKDQTPRSISEFRAHNGKGIRQWMKTQTEARKVVQSRLGRIEDKFFSLIPKALAFKPIDDIKDFVYSYVLDEKEVNIDVLRENVRTYQDLERTLESVRRRMQKLERIEKLHDEAADNIQKDQMYTYFLARAAVDIAGEETERLKAEKRAEEYRKKETEKDLEAVVQEKEQQQEIETNLRVELKQNREFLALEEQEKELERLKEEEKELLKEKGELLASVKRSLKKAEKLLEIKDVDGCIARYRDVFGQIDTLENTAEAREILEQVIQYKKEMYEKIRRKAAEVQIHLARRREELKGLEHKIGNLEKKKLSYPESVERLREAVLEEFARISRKAEPRVLCEALEITDESWRNAVEGYLNTQRFYLLVEPENFDIALGTYDRLRREKKAYGVGLINARGLEQYDKAPEGTLASVVTSKNPYARRFVNMVLGKVQMCSRYEDLKKYPVSITRECMKYQNRVASAIRPEIFRVPFIGQNAFKVQLEQAKTERKDVMIEYKTEYNFGAAPNMQGYPEFEAVYERLRTSEVLEYEDKVQSARKAAEDEFREQFLAKLQENMKQAQNEFKELNKALKDITFSNERYEFLYMPSRRHRRYYEMIMDDFNMIQGESIFSGIFHETHKEVIEELFDRLAIDNDNNARTLEEFTDYRTYMDYDIRILHMDGSYSLYSKVCEEKSGGETQTPFYVTVAASFVQLYGNNIGGEAAGLVMFDEAFNNMDDERIGGVLEFLQRLPLQIIIAAPPDKIQYISPAMEETLLVMTDEKVSYVEEYYNGAF